MGVLDGQPVNAAITNPSFINKNIDDQMPNILGLTNTFTAPISDIQAAANKLYTATGASEAQPGTNYNATPGTITNGVNYQTTLQTLAGKFDPVTGHFHSGAAGDGPMLDVVYTLAVTGNTPQSGNINFVAASGMMITQGTDSFTFASLNNVAVSGHVGITGTVNFIPGSGILMTQGSNSITIATTGGGGGGGGIPQIQVFKCSIVTFTVSSANATSGAVYGDGTGNQYTVVDTIVGSNSLDCFFAYALEGSPPSTGILTLRSGTGDSTIAWSAVPAFTLDSGTWTPVFSSPSYIEIEMCGSGGGGAGSSGTNGANPGSAGFAGSQDTSFGPITARFGNGGIGGITNQGALGGLPTVSSPAISIVSNTGGSSEPGDVGIVGTAFKGGLGGTNAFGGSGPGGASELLSGGPSAGYSAISNTGGGGGGGGGASGGYAGDGGSAGAYIRAIIVSPASSYSWTVGFGGVGGLGGASGGMPGGPGGSGIIIVTEYY